MFRYLQDFLIVANFEAMEGKQLLAQEYANSHFPDCQLAGINQNYKT